MDNAPRDENRVTTLLGVDHVGFDTPTTVAVDSTTHEMLVKANIDMVTEGISTSAKQDTQTTLLQGIAGFTPSVYDYVALTYTGDNLTGVVFKTGGSGGSTISTLTLAYSGSTLTSVTKT